jgi:hypothetical protein
MSEPGHAVTGVIRHRRIQIWLACSRRFTGWATARVSCPASAAPDRALPARRAGRDRRRDNNFLRARCGDLNEQLREPSPAKAQLSEDIERGKVAPRASPTPIRSRAGNDRRRGSRAGRIDCSPGGSNHTDPYRLIHR